MSQTTIRLEPALKKDFARVCENMGLSVSSAITIFAKTVVREQRIPFEITASTKLNAVTYATIEGIEASKNIKRFDTPEELFKELKGD